jgi:hypothetical protein
MKYKANSFTTKHGWKTKVIVSNGLDVTMAEASSTTLVSLKFSLKVESLTNLLRPTLNTKMASLNE